MATKNSNSKQLKTFDIKKDSRRQAKKRKLEAFLNLVRKDEEPSLQNKNTTFAESYKALKNELKKYEKKDAIQPFLNLTQDGKNALINVLSYESTKFTSPLFVEDVYHLLLRSLLGNLSPFPIRWAKLVSPQSIDKTVLVEIEGMSQNNVLNLYSDLNQNSITSFHVLGIISANIPFATELSTLHLASDFYSCAKENCSSLFPMKKFTIDSVEKSSNQNSRKSISKLHLLLSPVQLVMEHFPLPKSVFEGCKSDGYGFTKDVYTPVTADSPMYALDCEMCRVASGNQEVTRVAVVDENLETVYHKLVKPEEKIVDYLTRYSGVTEKMLRTVQTRLKDVHKDLRALLPTDAILVGQSLNCDLHALKMIHPYIIDTSIIYNQFGVRQKKTSLKKLARIYLKEVIQDAKKTGHNPIEDSIASMKLVQLKLKNCIEYGDAVLSSDMVASEDITGDTNNCNSVNICINPKFSDFIKLNDGSQKDGFFTLISKLSSKSVCLIGSEGNLSNYHDMLSTNVTKVENSSVNEIFNAVTSNLESTDLIMSHITLEDESNSVAEVNEKLRKLYESLPNNTLFLVILSSLKSAEDDNFKHMYCMVVLKTPA